MTPLGEREKILAIDLALRRPPSLRRAARRDTAEVCKSASRRARLVLMAAVSAEGLATPSLHLPDDAELAAAFRKSLSDNERITLRLREAEAATYEEHARPTMAACCELRLADIDEI